MENKLYIKRINNLQPEVEFILNKNNEFVLLTEDISDLISFDTPDEVQNYIVNDKKLFYDITMSSMMQGSYKGDDEFIEFMNRVNYEVGFVGEQWFIGGERLKSTALKEQVKQHLFDEKEKQKKNVKELLSKKIALQNEVSELKEILNTKESK